MTARGIAWTRINFTIGSGAVALIATAAFGDRLTNDAGVLGIIATIFSILSGVLIAVISILGDPSMIMDQSWRHSYVKASEVQRKLHRNTDIFVLYVTLLGCLLIFALMKVDDPLYWFVQRASFFLTVLGFFASLALPYALTAIQKQRLEAAVDAARKSASQKQG